MTNGTSNGLFSDVFFLDILAAAEGAFLGTYYYDMLKNEKKPAPELKCYTTYADSADRYLKYEVDEWL